MDAPGPPVAAEDDIGLLCLVVANGFNDAVLARLTSKGFADTKVSHGFVVQGLLAGDRTVTQLADRLQISVQAVSKTVQEMEALGYLERSRDPADGRAWVLALSARGRANLAEARLARAEVMRRLEKRLGKKQSREALRQLRRLADEFGGLATLAERRIRPQSAD